MTIYDILLSSNSKIKKYINQNYLKNLIYGSNLKNPGLLIWMLLNTEEWMQSYKI